MRILTRYILKEIFSHSLLGLLVFTFVIFIRQLGNLLELVVRHNVPLRDMATLFLLPVPSILMLTIPMAVLVGTLIGLSRMAADGEVIAARASGMGLSCFVRPVMLLAVTGWAVTLWMGLFLAPQAARKMNRMETGLKASQVPYEIQPRVFIEQFPNLLLYLEDVTGSRSSWRGVFIADMTQRNSVKVTLAESGVLVNEAARNRFVLHLEQGTTHEYDPQHPEEYSIASFTDTEIPIPIDQGGTGAAERSSPPYLNLTQLWQQHSPAPRSPARPGGVALPLCLAGGGHRPGAGGHPAGNFHAQGRQVRGRDAQHPAVFRVLHPDGLRPELCQAGARLADHRALAGQRPVCPCRHHHALEPEPRADSHDVPSGCVR